MRRLALAMAAAVVSSPFAEAAPLRPAQQLHPPIERPEMRRRRFFFPPFVRPPRIRPLPPPSLLPTPPPGRFIEPLPPEPGPLGGSIGPRPPLSHGFQMTVPVGAGAVSGAPTTLTRYLDVGQALGACFLPPAGLTWGSITLRVSFKRDGAVFGDPRIPYTDAGGPEQKAELARSLRAALKRCTPLPLSPSLGGAIAGEIFAIRFIHQDKP